MDPREIMLVNKKKKNCVDHHLGYRSIYVCQLDWFWYLDDVSRLILKNSSVQNNRIDSICPPTQTRKDMVASNKSSGSRTNL